MGWHGVKPLGAAQNITLAYYQIIKLMWLLFQMCSHTIFYPDSYIWSPNEDQNSLSLSYFLGLIKDYHMKPYEA